MSSSLSPASVPVSFTSEVVRRFELCIQFGEFVNIDIFRRGTYQLKVKIKPSHPTLVTKVNYGWGFNSPEESTGTLEWKSSWLTSSQQHGKTKADSFRSPTFFIQTVDERVLLLNGGTFQVALAKPQPSLLNSTVDDINNVSNSYSPSGGGSSVYSEDSNWLDGFECAIEISLYFSDKKLLGRVPGAASGGNLNTQPIQTRRIELPKTLFQCSGNRTIIPKYTSVRFDGTFFSSLDVLFSVFDLGDAVAFHHKKQSASTSINQQQPQTATKTLRPVTASIFKSLQTMFVPASGSSNNASNIDDAASNISDANSINNDGLSRTSSEVRFSSVLLEQSKSSSSPTNKLLDQLTRQRNQCFSRLEYLILKFNNSLSRQFLPDLFTQVIENKYTASRLSELKLVDTEFNTIRQWLEFQTSMSTDEQSDAELVESIQNLKLTLFDEVLRDRPDLLLLYFQTLEILNELLVILWKLLLSQTIEEGGLFVSMNSIRNFRVAWAQTLRRKYVNTCIVDSDGQTLIPEEEISDWLSDLQEFESLGDMQLYSPEHYNQCRIENIQSLKPFENISSADNKCNKNNNNPLSSRATIRNLIKSKTIAGPNEEGVHLYIYVHGFMGSPNDFRVYRNQMKYFHSLLFDEHGYLNNPSLSDQPQSAPLKTDHLLSESNHEKTDKIDIVEMGGNLALEISSFISDNQLKIAKLSFICHSLGGLIARSALAHDIIQRYPLELFQTFSTPHVSISLSPNMLFNSGLSVLRSFQTSPALEQCLLNDKSQQGPLLFDLSLDAFLGRFKTIRFFGSKQDGYTPQESACLCYTLPGSGGVDAGDTPGSSASSPESLNTSYYSSPSTTTPSSFASSSSSQNESLVHSMQQNMMQSISNSRDCRVFEAWNVNFKTMGRTSKNGILDLVDSFSGRKAHIALLDEAMFSDLCVMLNDYHV